MKDEIAVQFAGEYLGVLRSLAGEKRDERLRPRRRVSSECTIHHVRPFARIASETAEHHLHHEPIFESPKTSFDLRDEPLRIVASNPRFHRDYPIFIRRGPGHITSAIVTQGFDLIYEWFGTQSSEEFAEATANALAELTEERHVRLETLGGVPQNQMIQDAWMLALLGEIERISAFEPGQTLAAFLSHVSLPPRSCVVEIESPAYSRIIWNGKTYGRGYGLHIQRPKTEFRVRPYNHSREILLILDSPWCYVIRAEGTNQALEPHIAVGIFQDSTPVKQPRSDVSLGWRARSRRWVAE